MWGAFTNRGSPILLAEMLAILEMLPGAFTNRSKAIPSDFRIGVGTSSRRLRSLWEGKGAHLSC